HDSYIFQRFVLGGVEAAEYLESGVAHCLGDDGELDAIISNLWCECMAEDHPDPLETSKPNPKCWHRGFVTVVDMAEENRLFALARHVLPNAGLIYPKVADIDFTFINGLDTPLGKMDYDVIFDRAITNVRTGWGWLAKAIEGDESGLHNLRPWDLDTGLVKGEQTFDMWRA